MLYEGKQIIQELETLESHFKATYEYINTKLARRYTEKEILENNLYLEADGFQSAMFKVQELKAKIIK